MSRQGDLNEANLRVKRWAKAATEAGLVVGGSKPEVRYFQLWPYASRWRVFERLKWTLDGTPDGPIVSTECCVAAASSAPDAVLKYTLWARNPERVGYFRERDLRGEKQSAPPTVDPPEWEAARKAQAEAVDRANEATTAWVKRAVRAQMAHIGMDDPVKFELAWEKAKSMGGVNSR